MSASQWQAQVNELIERQFEDELTAADRARLNELLQSGADVRQYYLICTYAHHALAFGGTDPQLRQSALVGVRDAASESDGVGGDAGVGEQETAHRSPLASHRSSFPIRFDIVAAIILLAMVGTGWFFVVPALFPQAAIEKDGDDSTDNANARRLLVLNHSFEVPRLDHERSGELQSGVPGWRVEKGTDVFVGIIHPRPERFATDIGKTVRGADQRQMMIHYGKSGATTTHALPGKDGRPGTQDDAVLKAGATYRVAVAVGREAEDWKDAVEGAVAPFKGFEIALLAGDEVLASANGPTPPSGKFADCTIAYEAKTDDRHAGKPLAVRITTPESSDGSSGQIYFDNVRVFELTKEEKGGDQTP